MKLNTYFTKIAATAVVGLSLTACQSSPSAIGTIAGGLTGAALTRDASNYDRGLAIGAGALVGNVIGQSFEPAPSPCVTRQSGRVTERNGRYSQRQDTSYDCVYSGRPASANSPQFRNYGGAPQPMYRVR